MDPNLFHLDWDRTGEVLAAIVVFSMVIERALSILFESRWFIDWRDAVVKPNKKGEVVAAEARPERLVDPAVAAQRQLFPVKELVALLVSIAACFYWNFDAVSMIFLKSSVTWQGYVITGAIIAGGTKGSIKLYRDFLGFGSTAQKERKQLRDVSLKAEKDKIAGCPEPTKAGGGAV